MAKKMTKKDMFNMIINVMDGTPLPEGVTSEDIKAFCFHELENLNKKSGTSKKPTKTQLENEAFKADIVAYLTEVDRPLCIKEIMTEVASVAEASLTNQRISHMLSALVKAGTLVKEYEKKTPYFSVA